MITKKNINTDNEIRIHENGEAVPNAVLTKVLEEDGLFIYDFEVNNDSATFPKPISLTWKIPAFNVKGVWKPTSDFSKRIQADWELDHMESRVSIDAPVINLYGHDDSNVLTFACSNAINKLEMNALIREEDNNFYCHITFFSEQEQAITNFKAQIRLDYRQIHFSKSLKDTAKWWESFTNLKPAYVPQIAKEALYSTWYQFHQELDTHTLLKECKLAYALGYKSIIIDDGWQTNDSNRGYDYTGDWEPERIPKMASFIENIHKTGMKAALWYSVPFCGKKSKAYQKFKGKFLTENHRWAPVFDLRYPEIREYLLDIYKKALINWNLDGFKLDFIDDFKLYPDTPDYQENKMDYTSINEAVDRLLTDVALELRQINPEVFIEFRQKYIGPAMRKYGNMLRAFDCPGDATMNRVRIADIKMLCGNSAVHSDMVTWHKDEPVEIAALQLINTFFGVPQLSIKLEEATKAHSEMIAFYTAYWNKCSSTFLEGNFTPYRPSANYPIQSVFKGDYGIIGIYDAYVVDLNHGYKNIDLLNAQLNNEIVIKCNIALGDYKYTTYDCQGTIVTEQRIFLNKGLAVIEVPPCGIVQMQRS